MRAGLSEIAYCLRDAGRVDLSGVIEQRIERDTACPHIAAVNQSRAGEAFDLGAVVSLDLCEEPVAFSLGVAELAAILRGFAVSLRGVGIL
ncbi:hypothetical protein HLY00_2654 [Mycolicibacterium hippocampi]|uniref:Uncharacterized protein n=1 Tax=Mycolicibacterium hippocampi TaxID=659824 RepID=A0A850PPH3_9MYCO|nr:hypothetical protein [Mycolicibacterium hippocampi]